MKMHPEGGADRIGSRENIKLVDVRHAMGLLTEMQRKAREAGKDMESIPGYDEALAAQHSIQDSGGDEKVMREEGRKLIQWLKGIEK